MKKLAGVVSHHEAELAELRANRELAVEYLKAAMESLDNPDDRAAGLLALRTVAEAGFKRKGLIADLLAMPGGEDVELEIQPLRDLAKGCGFWQ